MQAAVITRRLIAIGMQALAHDRPVEKEDSPTAMLLEAAARATTTTDVNRKRKRKGKETGKIETEKLTEEKASKINTQKRKRKNERIEEERKK